VDGDDGEDVPGGGDYVGGDEVDLVAAVGGAVGVEVALERMAALEEGAFNLDAEEMSVVLRRLSRRERCRPRVW